MKKIIFDLETNDPDDALALLLLVGHPRVDLRAITVTPGSPWQIGIVRHVLKLFGKDIPVGAFDIHHPKQCVSAWHYKVFGDVGCSYDARPGWEVLLENFAADVTLVTGAPLKNMRGVLSSKENWQLGRWMAQGGFAGEGVVPLDLQLTKFKGKRTCPTFNFNGDPDSALGCLNEPRILEKRLVSKNVCHGVIYDKLMHARFADVKRDSLIMLRKAMDIYLNNRPEGKAFHDPLAAMCAIDPSIGEWKPVRMFREKGEWGAELLPSSDVSIIINYNHEQFVKTMLE